MDVGCKSICVLFFFFVVAVGGKWLEQLGGFMCDVSCDVLVKVALLCGIGVMRACALHSSVLLLRGQGRTNSGWHASRHVVCFGE